MEALEVNMYVRTKEGNIEKICAIENEHIYTDDDYLSWYPSYKAFNKASHNIIDLIEVGDYVNGEKVSSIQYEGMGFEHIKCIQTICKFDSLDNQFYTETYYNKDIKSILTKEQFEAIQYKVV